jgi:hypothetical protein
VAGAGPPGGPPRVGLRLSGIAGQSVIRDAAARPGWTSRRIPRGTAHGVDGALQEVGAVRRGTGVKGEVDEIALRRVEAIVPPVGVVRKTPNVAGRAGEIMAHRVRVTGEGGAATGPRVEAAGSGTKSPRIASKSQRSAMKSQCSASKSHCTSSKSHCNV